MSDVSDALDRQECLHRARNIADPDAVTCEYCDLVETRVEYAVRCLARYNGRDYRPTVEQIGVVLGELERLQAAVCKICGGGNYVGIGGVNSAGHAKRCPVVISESLATGRVTSLEALTDPCPKCEGEGWTCGHGEVPGRCCSKRNPHRCKPCGGVGRIPKQPDTTALRQGIADTVYEMFAPPGCDATPLIGELLAVVNQTLLGSWENNDE